MKVLRAIDRLSTWVGHVFAWLIVALALIITWEIIVIFMPSFIPLLAHFNIDPLFFGLLVALNLQTASCRRRLPWQRSI